MKKEYSFKLRDGTQDYVYHVVKLDEETLEVVWYDKGTRRSFTTKPKDAQHSIDTGQWIVQGKQPVGEMLFEIKQSYKLTIHHFLRLIEEDEFFVGYDSKLDLLTVLLGEDKKLEKAIKRTIEEHLRDEASYHAIL